MQTAWLKDFKDGALLKLVDEANANNPNLRSVQARLDKARAQSKKARASLLPILNAGFGANRTDPFENTSTSTANLGANLTAAWEADIWGRLGANANAANLRKEAGRADYNAARHVLAASVAENYFLAIEAERLSDVSQKNLDALNKTLGFVTVQYERGLRSGQDISLIRADVASAKVGVAQSHRAARDAKRALEILLGRYPGADLAFADNLPAVPASPGVGQPVDILTRRPDLVAAKHRVHAAYQNHKATKAAQKPSLNLSGVLGGSSNSLAQIFDPASLASTLVANVTAPLFDGGSRRADIAVAQADIDEAMASYHEIVINAYQDAEQQLDREKVLAIQESDLTDALSDARDALKFTQFQYESGENDLLNVLSIQQRVSFIEGQLVSTRRARLVQYVSLALALGAEPI